MQDLGSRGGRDLGNFSPSPKESFRKNKELLKVARVSSAPSHQLQEKCSTIVVTLVYLVLFFFLFS